MKIQQIQEISRLGFGPFSHTEASPSHGLQSLPTCLLLRQFLIFANPFTFLDTID
jgi:hypothetical protein